MGRAGHSREKVRPLGSARIDAASASWTSNDALSGTETLVSLVGVAVEHANGRTVGRSRTGAAIGNLAVPLTG